MNNLIHWDSPIENLFIEIETAKRKQCISEDRANELYEEINGLILKLTKYLNHNNSTSLSKMSLHRILKTMNYICIHGIQSYDNRYECFKEININELFDLGESIVKQDIQSLTLLLEKIKDTQLPFDNDRYLSIIQEQLPDYLQLTQGYNAIFHACHIEGDLDYPLLDGLSLYHDMYQLQGSDLALYYIKRFSIEHAFCHYFYNVLPAFVEQYEALKGVEVKFLGVNLCEIILNQLIANQALQREMDIFLKEDEIPIIKDRFTTYGSSDIMQALIKTISKTFPAPILSYIKEYKNIIEQNIERFLAYDYEVFIYEKPLENKDAILLNIASNNRIFLDALAKLQKMKFITDKISYLKEYISSVYDLIDLLEADIFFCDEYLTYYDCLSPQEIAIILIVMQQDLSAFHQVHHLDTTFLQSLESTMVWMDYLKRYLSNLKDVNRIKDIEIALQTITIVN